uniref:MFS domain-containing protein n=1 Tax=Parastrongyloides trichosuri TaxID=131310 RepID=A0A0N4YZZ6_PARTI
MSSETMAKVSENKSLTILTIILILDLISFASILPLFPSIFERYSKNNDDATLDIIDNIISKIQDILDIPNDARYNLVLYGGFLGSLYSLLQFLCFPIFGGLSDVYGRKPMLIVSIIGSLFSYILWFFADNFTIFLLSRVVGGLTKASTSISVAIAADICESKNKVKGMALIGISFSVGFILGPLIGAVISINSTADRKDIFVSLVAIVISIVELFVVIIFLEETLPVKLQKLKNIYRKVILYINPKSLFEYEAISGTMETEKLRNIQRLSRAYFLFLFFYSGLEFTLSFLTHQKFSFNSGDQGKMYFFIGILMIILQGGVLRKISSDKQLRTVVISITLIIPAYIIIAISDNMFGFRIGLGMYSISSAFIVPCLTSMVADMCTEGGKGTTMGVFRSLGALARALGPIFSSSVFWLMGSTFCYSFIGILFVIPLLALMNFKDASTQITLPAANESIEMITRKSEQKE